MSADENVDVDPAIPLDDGESVAWLGRPRATVVLPSAAVGVVLAAAGVAAATVVGGVLGLAVGALLVLLGLAIPAGHYLSVANVQFLVTDRALYVKRGVLSRSVTQANHETVQNSSYAQDVTGSLFGYGSVTFEIAGGNDLAFRAIDDPRDVRRLVDRATGRGDGVTGGERTRDEPPGSLDQWRAVRDEVRAVRRALRADE